MKKGIFVSIICIVLTIGSVFLANEFEIFGIKFWGVRKENARREVFEQTQSYVEGKRQDLLRYRLEYYKCKDAQEKEAIRQTIILSFSNFPEEKLTDPDLRQFLHAMKNDTILP